MDEEFSIFYKKVPNEFEKEINTESNTHNPPQNSNEIKRVKSGLNTRLKQTFITFKDDKKKKRIQKKTKQT